MSLHYFKGHGTENDFVLLPDPDGWLRLDAATVVALCDRRAGIGADGVIRLVRTTAYDDPASVAARDEADWFMDYYNADGSPSEMCGNGIRVMARVLAEGEGIDVTQPLPIATRAGVRTLTFETDGQITVDLGRPVIHDETKVGVPGHTWRALQVSMGNPHAVAFVDSLDDAGELREPPRHDSAEFPDGVNVEFVERRGDHRVAMRVFERGSGETRSCGTGAGAVAVATAVADGDPRGTTYQVEVAGGRLLVTWTEDDTVLLTGPAVLVAEGRWLDR
ncbi:MAG: diaminopimelate epimerase [Nocardioidaceae bacterium]